MDWTKLVDELEQMKASEVASKEKSYSTGAGSNKIVDAPCKKYLAKGTGSHSAATGKPRGCNQGI